MAQRGRKGLVARWLEGKERSEEYARSTLPTNRWSLFWDILKGRFGKLVLINLIVLVSFLPIVALFIWRYLLILIQGASGPFGMGLGVSYPMIPSVVGVAEFTMLRTDLLIFGLLIVASAIAAIGLSGGMYIIRNLIWTEGVFVANDFWRGVKRNYWNVLEALLFVTVILFSLQSTNNLSAYFAATGADNQWLLVVAQVIGYALFILALLVGFWMISLGINYKQSAWALFRNAVIMTLGTLPQTIFFIAIALLPFLLLLLGGFFFAIGLILFIFFSFSFAMLVWMDYSQWAFDRFINPRMGVKTGKGLYNKNQTAAERDAASDRAAEESAAMREYRRSILSHGKSQLVSRPIRPIDDGVDLYQLPDSFTREDLQKLRESRNTMEEGVKAYEEEHKEDEQYVAYNEQFDAMQAALQEDDGKDKKKKKQPQRPKMLKKRR